MTFSTNYHLVARSYKIRRVSRNLIFTLVVAQGAEVVGQPVACHHAIKQPPVDNGNVGILGIMR